MANVPQAKRTPVSAAGKRCCTPEPHLNTFINFEARTPKSSLLIYFTKRQICLSSFLFFLFAFLFSYFFFCLLSFPHFSTSKAETFPKIKLEFNQQKKPFFNLFLSLFSTGQEKYKLQIWISSDILKSILRLSPGTDAGTFILWYNPKTSVTKMYRYIGNT